MKVDVSDDELKGLSPEERAALGLDDEEQDALKDVVDETGDETDDDQPADKGKAADDDDAGDDDEDADVDEDEEDDDTKGAKDDKPAKQAAADDDEELTPFVPRYEAPAVEKYDEQLKELSTQKSAVIAKFKAGEIEAEAMEQELDAIDTKRYDLERARTKAEMAAEQAEQSAKQQWEWEINRFMKSSAKEGVEYRVPVAQAALEEARKAGDADAIAQAERGLRRTRMLNAALDTVVKELGSDDRYSNRPSEWFLEEAHRQVKEQFNLGRPAAANDGGKKAGSGRRPDMSKVPRTLGDIPSAGSDDASTGDDEFAHLDKLEGLALEAAVRGMSPAQQERWARSAA